MNIFSRVMKRAIEKAKKSVQPKPVIKVEEPVVEEAISKTKIIELKDVFKGFRVTQQYGWTPFAIERKELHDKDKDEWMYRYGIHTGIDYGISVGTPLKCPIDGEVVVDDDANDSGRGIAVSIWNKKLKIGCRFYHLSSNIVKEGQKIKAGDIIGSSGNTDGGGSVSTGAHLHFEIVRTNNKGVAVGEYGGSINPLDKKIFRWVK